MNINLEIGLLLLQELALIALPAAAATMFAASRGVRSPVLLIVIGLVASGTAAMLVFWGFYASPEVGKTLTFLIEIGAAVGTVALWVEGRGREAMREMLTPLGLWVLASFFVVYLGFLHGSSSEPLSLAAYRFSHGLPTDNLLPEVFGDWFYVYGHHGPPPPFSEWLASDRPPLQIGYMLAARPFGWDGISLHYELLGVAVQQLWVPGTWALLRSARLGRRGRALAMIAAMVSDIAILHGFYVWPKLIAAAFVLAAAAMVFSPEWKAWARDPRSAALFAALFALAMLAHGSSVFMLVPILVFGAWRALPSWRWLAVGLASAVVIYAPWQAYQHWADPPGNRLVKWQLAGSAAIDDRGTLQTIVDEYRAEGLGGSAHNKWENVKAIVGWGEIRSVAQNIQGDESSGSLARTVEDLRWVRFLGLLPVIGFLLLGPLAMGARVLRERATRERAGPRGPEWRFALSGGLLALGASVFWALVMFGNSNSLAIIHQGSLALPLVAMCACAAAAYAAWPRFGIGLVAFNALFVLALYAPSLKPPPGTSYSAVAAVLATVSVAAFCLLAWRAPGTSGDGECTSAP